MHENTRACLNIQPTVFPAHHQQHDLDHDRSNVARELQIEVEDSKVKIKLQKKTKQK